MNPPQRLLIVDDEAGIRFSLRGILEDEGHTVFEAPSAEAGLEFLERESVDLVFLDIWLPGMDGLECLRELKRRNLPTRVIVLTMFEDENYVLAAMSAGALGYVQKSAIDTELFQAIDNVAAGRLHLNESSAKTLLSMLLVERQQAALPPATAVLSPRELEVLRWYARGFSLREIGEQLGLSVKTVDTYKTRIMEKLGFQKKSELIAYAAKQGLFEP